MVNFSILYMMFNLKKIYSSVNKTTHDLLIHFCSETNMTKFRNAPFLSSRRVPSEFIQNFNGWCKYLTYCNMLTICHFKNWIPNPELYAMVTLNWGWTGSINWLRYGGARWRRKLFLCVHNNNIKIGDTFDT